MLVEFAQLFSMSGSIDDRNLSLVNKIEKSGVKRIIAINDFSHEETSAGIFLMRQKNRMRELRAMLTAKRVKIVPAVCVGISEGVSQTPDLYRLTLNKSRYILTTPPCGGFSDETMVEYKNIILKEKLVPIIMYFERYAACYDDYSLKKLLGISSAIFQVTDSALSSVKLRETINTLIKNNRTVIVSGNYKYDEKKKYFSLTAPSRKLYDYLSIVNNSFYSKVF